ncbi:MAG: twin-arginine translocase TatA/TatE family subunit [Methylohalobius sp. ZOD2]|uniref:twin-arginine translocase TatA/TatE family subunit n=1 Tax=Methylohalobius crimeensis TaxID=244365 RepID=UPI0003B466B4|nr:twin-arginine translocase TatA/TatE family subunit [Methylohalobius crimeensis]
MGISIWQLLIVLAIVLLLFGTRRLRHLGSDLGGAIRGFKNAMGEEESEAGKTENPEHLEADQAPEWRSEAHPESTHEKADKPERKPL